MRTPPILAPLLILLAPVSLLAQGSLTPSTTPTPTMKTLQQIEPRIDLQNAPSAAVETTNANYHYIINQPGSYYLSANLLVTKPNGIQINADGVTLDLRGFQISRTNSGGTGLEISAASLKASVHNGGVKNFSLGIDSAGTSGSRFRDLDVSSCTFTAMRTGDGAMVDSCNIHDNTGAYGLLAGKAAIVRNCTAARNDLTHAISTGISSTISNCTAQNNTVTAAIAAGIGNSISNCSVSDNTGAWGIYALTGSSLHNCVASNSHGNVAISAGIFTASGCSLTNCSSSYNDTTITAASSTGMGFNVGSHSTMSGCAAYNNQGDGILISQHTVIRQNSSSFNGSSGDGAGIHSTGAGNRIEENNVNQNDRGIDVDGTHSIVVKNTARGNSTNFDIVADNRYGPIEDITANGTAAVSGNTAAANLSNTNPWANFAY